MGSVRAPPAWGASGHFKLHLRKKLERKVNRLYPEQYLPLYSMISFTTLSYVEAYERERAQQALIDRLLELDNIEERWDSGGSRRSSIS